MSTESKFLVGSICLTDLIEKAKQKHSAFSKGKNGKVYFNFIQWINDKPDNYSNHSSLLLNSTKDKKDSEGKIYVGNARIIVTENEPVSEADLTGADDLPF